MKRIEINEDMTKAEEKELFRKFYSALPTDSYLGSILAGVEGYVNNQIDNDFGIGIMEELEARQKDNDNADKIIHQLQLQVTKLDQEVKLNEGLLATQREHYHELQDAFDKRTSQLLAAGETLSKDHTELEKAVAAKDDEIKTLKSKLYDLLTK